MRFSPLRLLSLLLLLLSLVLLVWGAWPPRQETRRTNIALDPAGQPEALLTFIYPPAIRAGDIADLRLALEANAPAGLDSVDQAENAVIAARLDVPGLEAAPGGQIVEPLGAGGRLNFFWNVRAQRAGEADGKLWLHFVTIPPGGQGIEAGEGRLLTAQQVEIHTTALFGLNGPSARLLGGVGVILGAALLWLSIFAVGKAAPKNQELH